MEGNNSWGRRDNFREKPDRLGKSGSNEHNRGRDSRRMRQYDGRYKKKVPKVQLILEEAKHQLTESLPSPDFMVLTCFAEMTELEKSSLTQEWKNHLSSHMGDLPGLRQEIQAQLLEKKQQNLSGSFQEECRWMEATARDIQREIIVISNTFQLQCRELRSMQLKILQTNDFIQY